MNDPLSLRERRERSTFRLKLTSIEAVAESQLCCGCGVCATAQPDAITMVDDLRTGRRPIVAAGADTAAAVAVCPGVGLDAPTPDPAADPDLLQDWGPVITLWEGHAGDQEVRWAGSSGGAATALALHALDHEGFSGVVHIAARDDEPLLNHTVVSRNRDELLARTGSRYSPASPGDGLAQLEAGSGPYVFIGKPCDVAGLHKLRAHRPEVDELIGLTIAVFCAGTPSTNGTLAMLDALDVAPDAVTGLRYRGNGWPGRATVTYTEPDGGREQRSLSYQQSWGDLLQSHRQWRCHLCVDHTGEFADIAVGDPWYRTVGPDEEGSSLVLGRTSTGAALVERAVGAGGLDAVPVDGALLVASQPNLLGTRGAVWARIATLRVLGLPAPRYRGFGHRRLWLRELDLRSKVSSVVGTLRRVRRRGLAHRRPVVAGPPPSTGPRLERTRER